MQNFPDYERHVKEILFENKEDYTYKPYKAWTMKYPNWAEIKNAGKIERKKKNKGWHWIQGNSKVSGEFFFQPFYLFASQKLFTGAA